MFFSILTKNLNWEVLPKNLVTFKRWDGIRVFQIVVRGEGKSLSPLPPTSQGGIRNFTGGRGIFLPGEGNLRRSDFDDLNLFQS